MDEAICGLIAVCQNNAILRKGNTANFGAGF
jgi:hypothetical protein